ncbi:MAG: cytochrome P450 [Acidimicrobiia bacterium]
MGETDGAISTVPEVDYAFDPLAGPDLHDALAAARVRGSAVWVQFLGADALLVTGFADVRDLLFEDDRLPGGEFHKAVTEPAVGPTFISMSGVEHDVHRKLATPAFRSRAVDQFDERDLVPLAHELVDGFAARGEADLVAEFTTALPFAAITRKLGLPLSDYPQMRRWADHILSFPVDPEGARRAAEEVGAQIAPLLEARRLDPGDDILSGLLHAREGDEHLDDDEVFATTRLLFTVGATTTSHAMGNLLHAVLTRRDVYERACHEPAWRVAVVHELLRCDGPVAILPRIATGDVDVLGERVPAGTMVLLALVAANRDPEVFERPDEFDPDRPPQEVLTFGFGRKFCPGKHLARRELLTALDVLLERLPDLRLVDEEEACPRGGVLRHPTAVRVTWTPR